MFRFMLDNSDPVAEKLVRNGMLVEHDFGRYHIGELENALKQYASIPTVEGKLDIVTHAASYVDLLQRHIEKEGSRMDKVVVLQKLFQRLKQLKQILLFALDMYTIFLYNTLACSEGILFI